MEVFNYLEAAQFVPGYSNEDKAICYGITGGVAKYLSMINPKKYIFFSLSGYTDWFETLVDEDVILLTLDSLYE